MNSIPSNQLSPTLGRCAETLFQPYKKNKKIENKDGLVSIPLFPMFYILSDTELRLDAVSPSTPDVLLSYQKSKNSAFQNER
jgi:hypothetical protein